MNATVFAARQAALAKPARASPRVSARRRPPSPPGPPGPGPGSRRKRAAHYRLLRGLGHGPGWLQQDPRVHDPGGVQFSLRAAKRGGEQRRHLPQVPFPMVAPDRMVMGNRAAEREDRLRGRELDLIPLLQFLAGAAGGVVAVKKRLPRCVSSSEASETVSSASVRMGSCASQVSSSARKLRSRVVLSASLSAACRRKSARPGPAADTGPGSR